MWYEMTIKRRPDQPNFSQEEILAENSDYYRRVGILNKQGILFAPAGPKVYDRHIEIRFERADDPETVKNVFSDWGEIEYKPAGNE